MPLVHSFLPITFYSFSSMHSNLNRLYLCITIQSLSVSLSSCLHNSRSNISPSTVRKLWQLWRGAQRIYDDQEESRERVSPLGIVIWIEDRGHPGRYRQKKNSSLPAVNQFGWGVANRFGLKCIYDGFDNFTLSSLRSKYVFRFFYSVLFGSEETGNGFPKVL